jgi:hypothetical protein
MIAGAVLLWEGPYALYSFGISSWSASDSTNEGLEI